VVLDCRVTKDENCLPMIPSGKAHNEMLLADLGETPANLGGVIDAAGRGLV
jgi:acetolactate synthase-1/2/3 large subunit